MTSPEDVMPWVGLYTALASLICTLAMATDAIQALWEWKLWFPNKYFNLNATTITLIAIAMKLPMDLNSSNPTLVDGFAKIRSVYFLVVILANFLPSLGRMDHTELLMNSVALGILLITIIVNLLIQLFTHVFFFSEVKLYVLIFTILWPFSVALSVSTSRQVLEHRYKESQRLVSSYQEKMFSSKELRCYVKKHWMMVETGNPQFVIACSPVSCAFGVICSILAFYSGSDFILVLRNEIYNFYSTSDYKWSVHVILLVQLIGIVVGSIAPIFRCFTSIGHYRLSKKWSKIQLNVFLVENHWVQMLQRWKCSQVHSHIPGRHCKIVFHNIKIIFFNICIVVHIAVLVMCKTVCLIPRFFMILLTCCLYFFKSFLKRCKKVENTSHSNSRSEIEDYRRYVIQIDDGLKLSSRILSNTLHSVNQLLDESEKKEPHKLMKLLMKSTRFNGVVEFENDHVPPLYPEETHNCWSLVVVTLTSISIALPNIANGHLKGLLSSTREGLQIIRHIEECLYEDVDLVKARTSAIHVWKEVEVYRTWLQVDLQKKARGGKTSKEILKWLGDEAAKIVIQNKSNKRPIINDSPSKFIIANSMYKISQTILLHCSEQSTWSNSELHEWISTMIADVLLACFTNLPRVIKMKCHHHAIEKRRDNIRNAAQLLGRSKQILKILQARHLPNINIDSMAFIDRWRVLPASQLSNSSSNGSLVINIV